MIARGWKNEGEACEEGLADATELLRRGTEAFDQDEILEGVALGISGIIGGFGSIALQPMIAVAADAAGWSGKKRAHRKMGPSRRQDCGLEFGDIVGVSRGAYDHYGIFVDENEVISYTSAQSDIGDNQVQATSLSRFMRECDSYFTLVFPDRYGVPEKLHFSRHSACSQFTCGPSLERLLKESEYQLFSAEETVQRATSRLGEDDYNLVFNNCEHFVIWCKTGIAESHQVNRLLSMIAGKPGLLL